MRDILVLALVFLAFSVVGQTWQSLEVNPSKDGLEYNPLKGLTPLYNVNNDFPHSIRGRILGFDEIMFGLEEENIKWDIFDQFVEEVGQEGRFSYLQVNVDMGFNRSDLPAFLSNVERIYYDGKDPADGAGVPSMVVNYNNEELMTAMLIFIEKFGERYNDDPRVFLVHYGLYGIFGEWDLGFGKKFIPEGEDWEMTEANQRRITAAFDKAFDKKNLLARFPENVPESQAVGYSDGLYFGGSISDKPNFQWFFYPKLVSNNADENWKIHPIGVEIDPDVQPTVWENFPNTVIGLPGETQETAAIFNLTRPTFLFHDFIFNDITKTDHPVMWENALKATRETGYTFHINEYRLSASNAKPAIEINVQNTGLAPIYADWEVEYAYLDANGEIVSLGTSNTWNMRSIQPDVASNYRSFTSEVEVPDGTHTFMLKIINPLEAISTLALPIRFDNETQDINNSGWLTLGQATISGGNLGTLPTQVTDMNVTPSVATMGLFDQLQLSAIVLPANASNQAISWISNRPKTASVDENGLVTTNARGGDVIITAATQDGAIIKTLYISVESFWVIPGRIEAEGYSDVFNVQVIPAPTDEGGESVLGFIEDHTWMEYVVEVEESADFVVDFRASSPGGIGTIDILNESGDILQSVTFSPATSGWDNYETYTTNAFTLPSGRYTLRLDVVASAFNLNFIDFRLNPCTDFDTNLVDTSCDDGNPNTTNDTYRDNCECEGTALINFIEIPAQIEAEDYFGVNNVQVNPAPANEEGGGNIIGFIGDDTWMDYGVKVLEESEFVLDLRASSPFAVSVLNLLNDAEDTLTTIELAPTTDSYDTYGLFTSSPFTLPAGEYRLRLDVVASAFNLNWLTFRFAEECEGPRGTTCDDGDAQTVNDVFLVNCDCVGMPTSAFADIPGVIEAENYFDVFNVQVNSTPAGEDGGSVLGFIGDDTWMEYGVRVSEAADFTVNFRASSPFAASVINILNQAGDTLSTVAFSPATASYDTYGIYTSTPFTLPIGSHILRLDVVASAFNLNWIEFEVDKVSSVKSNMLDNNLIEVYPNPTQDKLTIDWKDTVLGISAVNLNVFNVYGAKVFSKVVNDNNIDLSSLSEGIYFLEFVIERQRISKKIIKN